MILGISTSARKDGITANAVKYLLEQSGEPYEFVSLAGKKLNGCIGCTLCAGDNSCKVQDDWNSIEDKLRNADAIVIGAPNYFNTINSLGHALLERTFCFRHNSKFALEGKPVVIISTQYDNNPIDPVTEFIDKFMVINKTKVIYKISASGYSQCYTCGFGHDCDAGNVVRKYGHIPKVEAHHLPPELHEQPDTIRQILEAANLLKNFAVSQMQTKSKYIFIKTVYN